MCVVVFLSPAVSGFALGQYMQWYDILPFFSVSMLILFLFGIPARKRNPLHCVSPQMAVAGVVVSFLCVWKMFFFSRQRSPLSATFSLEQARRRGREREKQEKPQQTLNKTGRESNKERGHSPIGLYATNQIRTTKDENGLAQIRERENTRVQNDKRIEKTLPKVLQL